MTNVNEALNKALGRFMQSSERLVKGNDVHEFFDGLEDTLLALITGSSAKEPTKKSLNQGLHTLIAVMKGLPMATRTQVIKHMEQMPDDVFMKFLNQFESGRYLPSTRTDSAIVRLNALLTSAGVTRHADANRRLYGEAPTLGNSSPVPVVTKALADSLDRLADATPEEVDRAKTGQSQLSADRVRKECQQGHHSVEGSVDFETERDLYMGNIKGEQELRKDLVRGAVSMTERIEKLAEQWEGERHV